VLVFGQQIEDVVQLTWNDVNVTEELVTIRLGSIDIALTDPLDGPWRQLATRPGFDMTAAHPCSPWVFRGYSPGHPQKPAKRHLQHPCSAPRHAARTGKAGSGGGHREALGYSPATIERHAAASAATYARYVAAAREQRNSAS